jgi:hypothetical protein
VVADQEVLHRPGVGKRWRLAILSILFIGSLLLGSELGYRRYNDLTESLTPVAGTLRHVMFWGWLAILPIVNYTLAVLILRSFGLRWWWIAPGVVALVALELVTTWSGLVWPLVFVGWSINGFAP